MMLFLKESPYVRQALHARLDIKKTAKDVFQPFQSRDSRLFYIARGNGELYIDGVSYPLQPDTILLFKAGTPYEWRIEDAEYYAINFDYSQAYSHIRQTFHPIKSNSLPDGIFDCGEIEDCPALEHPIVIYKAAALKRSIQNILAETAMSDCWNQPLLSSMMKQLLLELLRKNSNKRIDMTQNIKAIIHYIQENYNQPISNGTIADTFGYNPTYLGRIFKAQTGLTLHEFIAELRLNAAIELLKDASIPIGEVCKKVGISDPYHFSKFFKEKIGATPSQYRKSK